MVIGYGLKYGDVPKSQLCVPDDNLEDLEFFPNFCDDLIQLTELDYDGLWEDLEPDPIGCWKRVEPETGEQENQVIKSSSSSSKKSPSSSYSSSLCGVKKRRIEPENIQGSSRKSPSSSYCSTSFCSSSPRRCSHCDSEKTPQWREGPNGPKTLCNACGVRFKSGRLLPEYRPAASPSFDTRKHSNFHRKIIKKTGMYS